MQACQQMCEVLIEAGIDHVFGIPGGGTGPLFNAIHDHRDKIRFILTRHEQSASIMADVYGRLTGKPGILLGQGVFIGSSGAFGIMEAFMSSSPMIALTDTSEAGVFAQHGSYQGGSGEHGSVDLLGVFGRGGYEGIQNDSDGNVWVVEDSGGSRGKVNTHARQPNSFVYRLLPTDRTDLTKGGRMQALQVTSLANPGQPIVFHAGQADADILSQDVKDLHTYGLVFQTDWVTIHDTAIDGFVRHLKVERNASEPTVRNDFVMPLVGKPGNTGSALLSVSGSSENVCQ